MKKGDRRKANRRKNKPAIQRARKKRTNFRPNPIWGATDQKVMRHIVNQAIGSLLIDSLDIDFIGILEKRAKDEPKAPETIQ